MKSEKLSIGHHSLLYNRLKEIKSTISEYSFANLYLFRDAHEYEVIFDKNLFIAGKSYDGKKYLMPAFDIRTADLEYIKVMMKGFDCLFPIPEEWLSCFNPDEFEFISNDGDMDYVFLADKISTYQGKKLHNKRNLLQQFLDLYSHEAIPFDSGRVQDAILILDNWQKELDFVKEETDYYPCLEALKLKDELLLCGGIYYVESEPAGFILGEEIRDDMFALHFAKGLRKFKGLYQFMFNNCAKVLNVHYTYINFEQDLGKLPLRQAKSSYIPDLMIKKHRITLRNK